MNPLGLPSGPAPVAVGIGVAAAVVLLAVSIARARTGDRRRAALDRITVGDRPRPAVPPWFVAGVDRLDVPVDATALWPPCRVGAAVLVALVVVPDPRWLVAAVAIGVGGTARARVRSPRVPPVDAVAVVEALAAPLASGTSLARAVAEVGRRDGGAPAAIALAPVARSVDDGVGVQAALDRWAARTEDRRVALVVDALAVAGSSGGSQAVALIGAGRTIREREALAREVRALGSQARTSAAVLAATPVAFTSVVVLVDERVASFLCTTPAGLLCLVVGGMCDAAGWWWMRRLVEGVS